MNIDSLNCQSEQDAYNMFMRCCTSSSWVKRMVAGRPYADRRELFQCAEQYWKDLKEQDFLEAFEGHPKIGDVSSLREKYANTKKFAGGEQSGVNSADEQTLQKIATGNAVYEDKFGFIFIVCATGKSADDMLKLLEMRLFNDRASELKNAAEEQSKITRIRLEKLI